MHSDYIIELKNIKKSYKLSSLEIPALHNINLKIKKGEFLSLVGASGSGKSTLLNIIGCLDKPDEGKVLLNGEDLSKFNDIQISKIRNRKFGFVFQNFNLISVLNVFQNVALPLSLVGDMNSTEKKSRVIKCLLDVGLEKFAKHRPNELSGGQKQRVAIARALVNQPLLIIADEPTANLDSKTAFKIIDLLIDLNKNNGVTCIFSTHDEKLMSRVEKIIRLNDGELEN